MSWSTGELGAIALRAVRGAGQPWGVAEEAAWAVRWLIRAGLDGPSALAGALEADAPGDLLEGIALADRGIAPDVLQPAAALLMLPFVARVPAPGRACLFGDGRESFRIWAGGCDVPPAQGRLPLRGTVPAPHGRQRERAEVTDHAYRVLTAFAARTYAPATEGSRMRGAGAGLTDND